MKIAVLKEEVPGEARVALMPDSVKKLLDLGVTASVESGAGLAAARSDADYAEAGAEVSADRNAILTGTDVLVTVNRPATDVFAALKPGAVVLGFLRPLDEPQELEPALKAGLTSRRACWCSGRASRDCKRSPPLGVSALLLKLTTCARRQVNKCAHSAQRFWTLI